MSELNLHGLETITVDERECVSVTLCAPLQKRYHAKFLHEISKKLLEHFGKEDEKTKCQIIADELLERRVSEALVRPGNTAASDILHDAAQQGWGEEALREKLRHELRDVSEDHLGKILRSLVPLQQEDHPEKVIIPKGIWQLLNEEEQTRFVKDVRTCAEKMAKEKNDARLCLDFIDEIKDKMQKEVRPYYNLSHYRSGVWMNDHNITYIIQMKDVGEQSSKILKERSEQSSKAMLHKMREFLNKQLSEVAGEGTFKGSVGTADMDGGQKSGLLMLQIKDEDLTALLQNDEKREALLHILSHPPREVSSIKSMIEEQRKKVGAEEMPSSRVNWSGSGIPVSGKKEILRENRPPASTSFGIG